MHDYEVILFWFPVISRAIVHPMFGLTLCSVCNRWSYHTE